MAEQNGTAKKSIKLYITSIKGEGKYLKFWAVPEQSRKVFDDIERFLGEKSAEFETSSTYLRSSQVQCGNHVCVKSEVKGRWCRARVENNPTQYNVTVTLLDYGQEEIVSVGSIRAFDERLFTEHPPLAVECILGDVAPSYSMEWPPKTIKFCQEHMLNQTMCGYVIKKAKIPVVRLAKLGQNEPFVQLLINQGLANIQQYEQPQSVTHPKGANSHSPYRSVALDVNAPHLVKISYVDSPESFFVQLSAAEVELNNLMNAIDKHVAGERLSPLESPTVNMPCLAPFNYAGSGRRYFRTLVTAVEPRVCKVFLVDYGCSETKEHNELKVLPLNFLHLPVQAIKCSLPAAVNVTRDALIAATAGKHLNCHVLSFNGSSYVVKLSLNNNDLFTVSDPGFSFYNIMHLSLHSREKVLISYVCNFCEFFCQLERNSLHIKNIQAQLNADNVLQPINLGDCIAGAPVSVKYSEDGKWYRAKVLHVENPNNIKVTFVDYGNSETTSLSNIKRLSPELGKIPMQAIKCTLSGLENVSEPSNCTEIFQELTEGKNLSIEILSVSRETGYVVNLYDMSEPRATLNTKMKQHILGVQQHMTSRTKPSVPEVQSNRPKPQQFAVEATVSVPSVNIVEKLYISSFTSPSVFFGQLNKIDEMKLDEMQAEINELYSAAGHSKFIPSVGDTVCAKFSEDDNFYRAKVEECSGDSCKVFFVDYGNRETVDICDVHKIRPKFTVLPQFGVECALQSSPSADSIQQLKGIMEENVFEFNMLSEKNGKWIVSLTEDFVSNAPVLEFLRQHETPVAYVNQGAKQTEDSETDTWGDTSDMNDRRQYRGDGGGRRDLSRSYTSSDRQNKQEYFSDRQRNIPSRNFGDNVDGSFRNYGEQRTGGSTRNFGDRSVSAVKNFGSRADGPKRNFGDRSDGPPKNFGDRTHIPKKSFSDNSNSPPRNFEKSGWDDKSQRFGPKNSYNDNSSTKGISSQLTEASRTLTQSAVTESPKLTDYSNVIINNGTYREVYVSHIVNPGEFYCQTTEEKSKVPVMMEEIACKYTSINDNEKKLTNPAVGQPCCAIYSEDGCWYRGKIIDMDNLSRSSAYNVFFVDYGNTEKVPASKVKCLDPEFFSLPPLALKCALFNVLPQGGSWSQDDIKTFINMALDRCFVAKFEQVDSSGTHLVNLLDINKLQDDIINKDLTVSGHGRLADANKMLVINSQVASTNLSFPEPDIQDGTTEEVIVTWVVNPVEFYCQLQSFVPVFTKMMKDLQAYYGKTTDIDHVVDRPQPGMICVAQFSEDNAWYRAKVVSVEKHLVDVYYVDYGNSEQVTKKKVKYIHQDFTIHPVQGIRCQLHGIRLSGESSISKSLGQKYFGGKTICTFVKKVDDLFYVTLLNDSKNVAKELLHTDVVLSDPQSSHLVTSTESAPAVTATVNYCIPKKQLDMSPGTLLNVTVPFIESPKQFWCHLLDSADQLEDLMDSIDAHYSASDVKLRNINAGCGCVAQYSEDGRWYRAVIKCIDKETDNCEVFFVDYGNTDIIKSSEIKVIEPEFCDLPAQAIECRLHGTPETVSSEATTEFMKVLESEELLAKVEFVDNDVLVVTLLDSSGEDEINVGESIFGPILENQVDTKVPAFSKPTLSLGVQRGYISHVNDPSDFYMQLEETEEELSDYASALSEYYECLAETDLVIQDASVGMACCAKFTDDNQWYRAEITDLIDSSATVLFVDYGNTDVVQVHSVKKLTEDFLKKPPYAFHCTLAAVKPLTGSTWSAEAITVFEQTTSDTLLTIKFESQELPMPVVLIKDEEDVAKHLADLQLCCYDKTEVQNSNMSESISYQLDIHGNRDTAPDFKHGSYAKRVCDVKCAVRLSFAYSLDKFFVTPNALLEELELITEKLQEFLNTDEESDMSSFAVAQPCAAKYSEDNTWYRALITNINDDAITVLFVDFGNSEVTHASCLKPLKSELLEIPPFSVECCLFGVKSVSENQDEITAKLEELVDNDVEFEMEIIESSQPLKVKLRGEKDLAEQLVDEGLAEYVRPVTEIASTDHFENGIEMSSSPPPVLEKELAPVETYSLGTVAAITEDKQAPVQISVQDVRIGKMMVDVKYVDVLNNLIVLHVVPSHQKDALTHFQDRLNETYGCDEKHYPCSPSSKYCVAKSSKDDCWYRAEILHVDEEHYYVRYVDFGNCESVSSENVTELLPEFSNEHQFSISCCMFGVKIVEGSEDDVQTRIFDIVGENLGMLKISCNVHGIFGMCWGLLVVVNGNLNVMQILVEEGLACHIWPPVQLPGDEFDAEINNVETHNDLLLNVIPSSWIEEHEHFHKDLQEACRISGDSSFDINSNLMCAVLSCDEWNRGYVISSTQEEVIVYLIDSGFTKTVSPSSVKPLPSEFCQKAPLILRCSLHNWVFPMTDTMRHKFCEICMSKTAKCKVKDYHSAFEPFYISLNIEGSDVFSCMVQYVDEESNIAELSTRLQEALESSQEADGEYSSLDNFKESAENFGEVASNSGYPNEDEHFDDAHSQTEFETSVEGLGEQHQPAVALMENAEVCIQKYPERSISNKCTVKLSYVYSSDRFHVSPIELQEQLDYITSVLNEQYDLACESDGQALCEPCVMQPCVAQYAEDMAWYRAVILDVKSEAVSVLFIDFGNTEVVESGVLRVITPELLKIAPVAVECSLFGIQIIPGNQEEVNSRLRSMSDSEVELEMEVIESHESPYKVRLKGDVDISEQFVNDGLCEYYVTPSQKLQDSETFKENLRIAFLEEPLSLEENKGIIAQQNVSLGKMFVSVKYVELSEGIIILHVVPDNLKDALTNIQEKLQAVYSNTTCSSLQTSSKFCAAKSSDDGVWYRAQLLEQREEGYNVKFVDYGNCDIIPFSDVRELLPEFVSEIQYSIACCLSGVKIIPGQEEAVEERIYDLVSQTETAVEIYDIGSGNIAMCRAALKIDIDCNDVSHILAEEGLVLQVFPARHLPGTSFEAHVEEIVSREQLLFYVIPTECIEARCSFEKELLKACDSADAFRPDAIYSNCLYAAVFDEQWYRVSIVSISADSVVVNLVDYGKCKSVNKELLQYLEPEFCHKPPFVLQCILSGWQNPISDKVCKEFAEICHGKTVACRLVNPSSHNSEPYVVSVEIDGEDIFPHLTEFVERNSSEILPQVPIDHTEEKEDIVHMGSSQCNDAGTLENTENEDVLDAEFESAGTGDLEKNDDLLDNSSEIDSHFSPQKDFFPGVKVGDFVGHPQSCETSEFESASPAIELTTSEGEEDSIGFSKKENAGIDTFFQDSSVTLTPGPPKVGVNDIISDSVSTESSLSLEESSQRHPIEDSSSYLNSKQHDQNEMVSEDHDVTVCKNVMELNTVGMSEGQEQCTSSPNTSLNGADSDGHSSSAPLDSSVCSQSNVKNVQADNSENMDMVHTKVTSLCNDSYNMCEENE